MDTWIGLPVFGVEWGGFICFDIVADMAVQLFWECMQAKRQGKGEGLNSVYGRRWGEGMGGNKKKFRTVGLELSLGVGSGNQT